MVWHAPTVSGETPGKAGPTHDETLTSGPSDGPRGAKPPSVPM